jgi:catechol 2,3-dioxygenase-like lactoylglutathione lyase family enzyme
MAKVHHTAICTNDIEESLRFWRDGMGFEVTMDHAFDGPWTTLFRCPVDHLRSIFLGDPRDPSGGILELVDLGTVPEGDRPASSTTGFFLVSVYDAEIDSLLDRLTGMGLAGSLRRETVGGVEMAVVEDPSGVMIEIVGLAAPNVTAS